MSIPNSISNMIRRMPRRQHVRTAASVKPEQNGDSYLLTLSCNSCCGGGFFPVR